MEAVIAIGIVAVAVPLILAATSAASKSRINSEADTRAAWIGPGNPEVHASGSSNPDAYYMVAIHGEAAIPSTADQADNSLSKVFISVEHNAKSPRSKRNSNPFIVLIPRQIAP
jgi:hypothetical protein